MVRGIVRRAGCLVLAAALSLGLSGCAGKKAASDVTDDGTVRSIADSSYVNALVQLGFKSDMGNGFYEFYYETDGEVSHVYDMSATMAIQGQTVAVSGEIWSDGVTGWSTSGNGWVETGIPMHMDIAKLPGLFGYDGSVQPKRDDEAGYYVFEWETDLAKLEDSGVFSLVGELDGLDLSGTAEAVLRTEQSDGSFVSICVNADAAALCVLLNHIEDGKTLEIPQEAKALPAVENAPVDEDPGQDDAQDEVPEVLSALMDTIRADDGSLNLLEAASDHGTSYVYYETNLVNAWYAWAEIGCPDDGDVDALFASRLEAMESVLGEGAYEPFGDYLIHVQKSDPSTEEGLNSSGDWYVYLLARDDEFVLNMTIQDWTSKDVDGVMDNAREVIGHMGRAWRIE